VEWITERERWERERLLESLESYRRGLADAPVVSKFAVDGVLSPAGEGPLTFVVSDESEDRLGDVIKANGWELDAYRRNPVFLWAHDYTRTPVGRSVWIGAEETRLLSQVVFAPTEFAREVETLYRQRFLRAVSVGFRAKSFTFRKGANGVVDGVEFTQLELLEVSAVPVPSNPQALAKAMHAGLEVPRLRSLFGLGGPSGAGRHETSDRPLEDTEGLGQEQARQVILALRQLREQLG
jgi:HK97 family phage prohead protease